RKHGADQPLPAAAVARRHDAADHREREREEAAGAEALDAAEDDELGHVLGGAAERRPDEEDGDRDQHQRPAAVDVAQPARDRHRQAVPHSAGTPTAVRPRSRSSAIAAAMPRAPTTSQRLSVSERRTRANTTEMKGWRFVKRLAREGPTLSMARYQRRLVR